MEAIRVSIHTSLFPPSSSDHRRGTLIRSLPLFCRGVRGGRDSQLHAAPLHALDRLRERHASNQTRMEREAEKEYREMRPTHFLAAHSCAALIYTCLHARGVHVRPGPHVAVHVPPLMHVLMHVGVERACRPAAERGESEATRHLRLDRLKDSSRQPRGPTRGSKRDGGT